MTDCYTEDIKTMSMPAAIRKRQGTIYYNNSLVIETDIGRDPDDFFALCYLISSGANIKLITVSPGDQDQIAFVKFVLKECGLDIPVGFGKKDRDKSSATGVHVELLKKYKQPLRMDGDGYGPDLLKEIYPQTLFAIGPLSSVGPHVSNGNKFLRATMQGGFLGYNEHSYDVVRLEKFEGIRSVATFNLNGEKKHSQRFIDSNMDIHFVAKNVCHTVVYDQDVHDQVMSVKPRDRAGELLREGMGMYLKKHPDGKKFHDPTAAVCHNQPDIATWLSGKMFYDGGKWGFKVIGDLSDRQEIVVDIDRERLWQEIADPTRLVV